MPGQWEGVLQLGDVCERGPVGGFARHRPGHLGRAGSSQIARQRLADPIGRVGQVKLAHVLQIVLGEAPPEGGRKVAREPLDQRGTVCGWVPTGLLYSMVRWPVNQ